jgi:PAS domain S-box-containing protein
MKQRTRGVAFALLPLTLLLVIAIPEAVSIARVNAASQQASRSFAIGSDARRVEETALDFGIATKLRLSGGTPARDAFEAIRLRLRGALATLEAGTAAEVLSGNDVGRVVAATNRYIRLNDAVAGAIVGGRRAQAVAMLTVPAYGAASTELRQSVRAFGMLASDDEFAALRSFDSLWKWSIALLVAVVVGMGFAGWVTLKYAGRVRERQLERYRLLADVTHDIILFIDRADLTIVDANAAALSAYGYTRAQLIGQPGAILHAAEDPIGPDAIAQSDTPAGLVYEGVHRRADGSEFPVEVVAGSARVDGRLTIVKTIRDISERRAAAVQVAHALDQALEASRLKSEFVATMSHEIRTPMHGVIGMSELLLETPLAPLQREYAVTLKESAQALLAIIDDILDFSKLEADKIQLEAVTFSAAAVVASAVNLARGASRDKRLALRSYASPHVPGAVSGDPARLRQVLVNLVGNAVKFTPDGSVTVTTSVERDDGHSVVLLFSVSDTGIGVSPAARERLFQPFVQGDGTMTRRFGGTGLGLSISRRLVELMGGALWLGEHEGPGATFCFTARFERTTEALAVLPVVSGALRVLVLDDDEATRRGLHAMLGALRIESTSVSDIDAARVQLAEAVGEGAPFDIVLIDYVLPRSDGLIFAAELGRRPELGAPALILITAFDAAGRKEAAFAAGCAAYLEKPVDPSELYDAVTEIERARHRRVPVAAGETQQARILLAEDSALIRRVTRFQLKELAFGVDIVENGEQAVTATAAHDYELVLMDMRMPEMDGLAATRAIRVAERESGRHVIVVALTANVLDGDREACIDAGMDDFLAKPLQLDALRGVLARWLPEHA